jgi:hypothetical protein
VCRVGAGDERAFPFVQQTLEGVQDDALRAFVIGNLYELDVEGARAYLKTYQRKHKLGPEARRAIENPGGLTR